MLCNEPDAANRDCLVSNLQAAAAEAARVASEHAASGGEGAAAAEGRWQLAEEDAARCCIPQ